MLTKNQTTNLKYSVVSLLACLGIAGSNIAIAKSNTNLHNANLSQVNIKTVNAQQIQASDLKIFKLKPRVSVWGFTGDRTLAKTQILFPLKGDNNKVLYAIGEGNYTKNDSSWMAGFGFGYRQIVDGKILGSYVIADYFNTSENEFIIANPGIEILGFHDAWDFSLNGYIPLDRQKKIGKEGWAGDDFENYSFGRATGHNFYDHRLQTIEEVGTGFDIEIGRTLPWFANNAKLYLGGYHFDTKDSKSINGVSTRFTYDLNKYTTLELENSYDNLHKNKFLVGVRFNLGGYSQDEKQQFGLSTRLLDPRNQGVYKSLVKDVIVDKGEQLQHDNVWYFKQSAVTNGSDPQQGSGTAEDPLVNFTQANYDVVYANKDTGILDPHPLMYFAPGEYSFSDFFTTRDTTTYNNRFALANGWGMYGRTSDYKARANGDDRARFDGGLDMVYDTGAGADATTLDSVRIYNTVAEEDNATLYIKNAGNVIFDNVYIDSNVSVGQSYGVHADTSMLNFNKRTTTVTSFSNNDDSTGINVVNRSILNFNGGINTINSSSFSSGNDDGSEGIVVDYGSTLNFNGGINTINSYMHRDSEGIFVENGSALNFNGGINVINSFAIFSCGIESHNSALNFNGGNNTINVSDNALSLVSGDLIFAGIYADNSILNFNAGINTVNSSVFSYSYNCGIIVKSSTLNFNGGTNTINSFIFFPNTSSPTIYSTGIYVKNFSTVNFNGGINTINSVANSGSSSYADDIYVDNAILNFNGGANNLNSSSFSTNDISRSYGIYAPVSSTLNFKNDAKINIKVKATGGSGATVKDTTGIYASSDSSIKYWNGDTFTAFNARNIFGIEKYVNFTKLTESGDGWNSNKKVDWNNNPSLNW